MCVCLQQHVYIHIWVYVCMWVGAHSNLRLACMYACMRVYVHALEFASVHNNVTCIQVNVRNKYI